MTTMRGWVIFIFCRHHNTIETCNHWFDKYYAAMKMASSEQPKILCLHSAIINNPRQRLFLPAHRWNRNVLCAIRCFLHHKPEKPLPIDETKVTIFNMQTSHIQSDFLRWQRDLLQRINVDYLLRAILADLLPYLCRNGRYMIEWNLAIPILYNGRVMDTVRTAWTMTDRKMEVLVCAYVDELWMAELGISARQCRRDRKQASSSLNSAVHGEAGAKSFSKMADLDPYIVAILIAIGQGQKRNSPLTTRFFLVGSLLIVLWCDSC